MFNADDILPQSSTARNLGGVFDQQMNMDQHITKLCQTINWQICNLYRISRYIDQETCANIVRAMLLSRLDYCNVLFNNIAQRDLDRLQRFQNKCARLVFMPLRRTNISPFLKKLHWLRIKDRISFKLCCTSTRHWMDSVSGTFMHALLLKENAKARLKHALTTVSTGSQKQQMCRWQSLFSGCSLEMEHHPHTHPQCSFCRCHTVVCILSNIAYIIRVFTYKYFIITLTADGLIAINQTMYILNTAKTICVNI